MLFFHLFVCLFVRSFVRLSLAPFTQRYITMVRATIERLYGVPSVQISFSRSRIFSFHLPPVLSSFVTVADLSRSSEAHTHARTHGHASFVDLPASSGTANLRLVRQPDSFLFLLFQSLIAVILHSCSFVSASGLMLVLPCVLFRFSLHSVFHPLFHSTVHPLSRCFLLGPSDFSRAFNTESRGALFFANRVTR